MSKLNEEFVNSYWEDRVANAQKKLTTKSIKETEAQLKKQYQRSFEKIVGQFEQTYMHIFSSIEEGRNPTPADLYNLDKYWKMQGQVTEELQKLGDKQAAIMSKNFMSQYERIYSSFSLGSASTFSNVDKNAMQQVINQIWCADGKTWKERIWGNISQLQETLNEGLMDCVVTGKKPRELKNVLQERFNVSYGRANTIVNTEMAHIQTQAAKQRYQDYGIQQVQVWADYDERRCEVCGNLHKKPFNVNEVMPLPAHPNCRCCIIPIVEE